MDTKLENKIKEECTAIDTEKRYREYINEVYGPDLEKIPWLQGADAASLMEENDPIMYSCGKTDWEDSEYRDQNWVEIGSEYYERKDCETCRDELVSELEGQKTDLISEFEAEDADDFTHGELEIKQEAHDARLEALEKEIAELNDEDFD